MPFWTYQNLAKLTQGTWLVPPPPEAGNAVIPAAQRDAGPVLWHDTREIAPGQCYLAIAGENFDGNRFVPQAFAAGAALAIVDSESAVSDQLSAFSQNQQPVLLVEDSVVALQQLARAYRHELSSSNTSGDGGCKVIGIAGSNGKTTTRHLIHHVLTHAGKTGTQSPKSFNNHLGVPLTLLAARPTDDFVACEIGTNHPGEIDFLSEIAKPDIAVITSIGEEHMEFFKDLDGVAEEESSILKYVKEDGLLVSPGFWDETVTGGLDSKWLGELPRTCKSVRVGQQFDIDSDRKDVFVGASLDETRLEAPQRFTVDLTDCQSDNSLETILGEVELNLPGWHNIANALYAIVVAMELGIQFDQAAPALASVLPPDGRSETIRFDSVTLIHDAYNANPQSVRQAINLLSGWGDLNLSHKVIVLGDMFELGEQAPQLHRQVIDHLSRFDPTAAFAGPDPMVGAIHQVILIGPAMCAAATPIKTRWARSGLNHLQTFPEWSDDLPDQVAALLQPGDTVLLKASRGMRLERLIPAIEKRFGKAQG